MLPSRAFGSRTGARSHRDKRAESNAELVEKAVSLADLFDREPATPDEARETFGLKGRAAVAFKRLFYSIRVLCSTSTMRA